LELEVAGAFKMLPVFTRLPCISFSRMIFVVTGHQNLEYYSFFNGLWMCNRIYLSFLYLQYRRVQLLFPCAQENTFCSYVDFSTDTVALLLPLITELPKLTCLACRNTQRSHMLFVALVRLIQFQRVGLLV